MTYKLAISAKPTSLPGDEPVKLSVTAGKWQDAEVAVLSLAAAVQSAGGSVSSVPEQLDMTLREFIAKIAGPNRIRFTHEPESRHTVIRPVHEGK